jgi:hypothetical protein
MSNEVGWSDPDEPSPAYAQPQVQSYPPPAYYAPPGYSPPGYYAPGYGYPPPGYPGTFATPLKPGIIPLRPLTLSDIFNGAVAYVRMNPKATLGMTAIVVITAQLLGLVLQIWPLAAMGALKPSAFDTFGSNDLSDEALVGSLLSSLADLATTVVASSVLSGLLTVIVGRAVFGSKITTGEAWRRARGRLLPLVVLTALQTIGFLVLLVIAMALAVGTYYTAGAFAALLVGGVSFVTVAVLFLYLNTILVFAPALIVLERLSILSAIVRSFALVKKDFWRVFGIWLLGMLVAVLIAGAVSVPFSIVGEVMLMRSESTTGLVVSLVLTGIGAAVGQIVTAPFTAGVVVLLYTDRRIRAEAFDLVLQTGARGPAHAPADSTDHLWLTTQS